MKTLPINSAMKWTRRKIIIYGRGASSSAAIWLAGCGYCRTLTGNSTLIKTHSSSAVAETMIKPSILQQYLLLHIQTGAA